MGDAELQLDSSEPTDIVCSSCELPTDPRKIFKCSTCETKICELCVNPHLRKKHEVKDISGYIPGVCCEHSALSLYFCETCKASACAICFAPHVTHTIKSISEEAKRIRNEIHATIMKHESAAKSLLNQKIFCDDAIRCNEEILSDASIPFDLEVLSDSISDILRGIHNEYKQEQRSWLDESSEALKKVEDLSDSSSACLKIARSSLVCSDGALVNNFMTIKDEVAEIGKQIDSKEKSILMWSAEVVRPSVSEDVKAEKIKSLLKDLYPQTGKHNLVSIAMKEPSQATISHRADYPVRGVVLSSTLADSHIPSTSFVFLNLLLMKDGYGRFTLTLVSSGGNCQICWQCNINVDHDKDVKLLWYTEREGWLLCRVENTVKLFQVQQKIISNPTGYGAYHWTGQTQNNEQTERVCQEIHSGTISVPPDSFVSGGALKNGTILNILTGTELLSYYWNSGNPITNSQQRKFIIRDIECHSKYVDLHPDSTSSNQRKVAFYGGSKPVITIAYLDMKAKAAIPIRVIKLSVKEEIVCITWQGSSRMLVQLESDNTINISSIGL